ncbi:MAG: copper-translocating P-type ATPase [Pseudomonadota bacterium]
MSRLVAIGSFLRSVGRNFQRQGITDVCPLDLPVTGSFISNYMVDATSHNTGRLLLVLDGLNCASCVARAEATLADLPGVSRVSVNLATGQADLTVSGTDVLPEAARVLSKAGYPVITDRTEFRVEEMNCASCVGRVSAAAQTVPGVLSASANLADGTLSVDLARGQADAGQIVAALHKTGYSATAISGGGDTGAEDARASSEARRNLILAWAFSLPVVVLAMGGHLSPAFGQWVLSTIGSAQSAFAQAVLTTAVMVWPARALYRRGISSLWHGSPDMNALVAIGTGAAWIYSMMAIVVPDVFPAGTAQVYFEAAAMVVTLVLTGRFLEERAKQKAGEAVARLSGLQPDTALVERDGEIVSCAVVNLRPGDHVHLQPGGRVAVDGTVVSGHSSIDEAMLTGEPLPVLKGPGDAVSAGTLNGASALVIRAEAIGADTMLARIAETVRRAQATKLPVQSAIDRVTAFFVPTILAVSVVCFLVWMVFGPEPALPFALVSSVSVLIVACPCAMGLAVPVAILAGTGRAAELGVIFRSGDALQRLQTVRTVAFDKTGTLTVGRPEVVLTRIAAPFEEDEALALAARVAEQSQHPLSEAVARVGTAGASELPLAENVTAVVGAGVEGTVGGRKVMLGTSGYLAAAGVTTDAFEAASTDINGEGLSAVWVAIDGTIGAVLGLMDTVRPDAGPALERLRRKGLSLALISGDRAAAAEAVAAKLGIDRVLAGHRPDQKGDVIAGFALTQGPVAFVGDGINDAVALAEADVGIAVGSGADVAVEAADVVLVANSLAGVPAAVDISSATMANIRQNLIWAFGYNVALIPVAAGVLYPVTGMLLSPMLAGVAMGASSLFVVCNALRLRLVGRRAGIENRKEAALDKLGVAQA